ncbi:hypothetical protein RSAG8_05459, partial [Rhizoctonia solani AG-8 WAC10335]
MFSYQYLELTLPTEVELVARTCVGNYLSTFRDSDGHWDTIKFADIMADLTSCSLVHFDRMNLSYGVHVLVQDWVRIMIPQTPEIALECTATLLSASIIGLQKFEDAESFAFERQLGPHVYNMIERKYEIGARHTNEAEKLAVEALNACKRVLGEDDLFTLKLKRDLSKIYTELGRLDEAKDLQIQTLRAHRQCLGEENSETLNSMDELAQTYSLLAQWDKAEELWTSVLSARERWLGNEHPDTLDTMNYLAIGCSFLGRHDEAQRLQSQILNACKRLLGEEHPYTLRSMQFAAVTYAHLGRGNKAQLLLNTVIDVSERKLGIIDVYEKESDENVRRHVDPPPIVD